MDKALLKQARRLNARNGGPNCPIPPIVLMTDDQRLPDPEAAIRSLPRDSMVIFRHYDHPQRAKLGAKLRTICHAKGMPFLVANDVALALRLDADGVHFPEYRALTDPGIYRRIPQDFLRTSACHSMQTLRQLTLLPEPVRPDGVLISPIFPTQSHPGAAPMSLADTNEMTRMCQKANMTPIGLGGINAQTIENLRNSALASVAGIGFSVASHPPSR
ncbi:thiamine phosphate synthase [Thalassospira sp. HF15]|uniref:thiamine phosphate synthase n=1 Tax=Thalassospira sp. HF15 TaxID=2722755 RepID=UPI00142F67E1|nr:thiamine phosphate synthase [Thalassospira sp. HF15]NIY75108.1 thiamine phosphate synthase [Thalassospira sp. HF15]